MSENENPEVQEEAQPEGQGKEKTIAEELNVAGNQLVQEVERLIAEGNVRRLVIKQGDNVLLDVSLTLGVVVGGAVGLLAPWAAVILGAVAILAAAVGQVTVVIERTGEAKIEKHEDE